MHNVCDVIKKEICTGCTACLNSCPTNCISMTTDSFGFAHPTIDSDKCVDCGKCVSVCPVYYKQIVSEKSHCYAAISKDDVIRMDSSSGGLFTEIALHVLSQNGVIFGASYDANFNVAHIAVDSPEELCKLRGAKYAQSDLGDAFSKVFSLLNVGREVLFSGTPCQIAGLKSFLGKDYENLITIDFVCHGVPSPLAWREYLKYRSDIDANSSTQKKINLRSKASGWSLYSYSVLFEYESSKYISINYHDPYMRLFVGDYINRQSCSECHFKGIERVSDITLGDFWGIWDIDKQMDDNKGTSLLIVHTSKGENIIDKIKDKIIIKETTEEESTLQNQSILISSSQNEKRTQVLELISNDNFEEAIKELPEIKEVKPSLFARIKCKIKRLLK